MLGAYASIVRVNITWAYNIFSTYCYGDWYTVYGIQIGYGNGVWMLYIESHQCSVDTVVPVVANWGRYGNRYSNSNVSRIVRGSIGHCGIVQPVDGFLHSCQVSLSAFVVNQPLDKSILHWRRGAVHLYLFERAGMVARGHYSVFVDVCMGWVNIGIWV